MTTTSATQMTSIPSLTPSAPLPSSSIEAVVSLVWPYSSRTHSYALLLSDPDFRLRYQRGQVRVVFTGAAGRAIARHRVGTGDKVVLDLSGGKWLGNGDEGLATVRTPGKSVEGEIGFEDALQMKVVKGDKEVSVTIEEQDLIKDPDAVKRSDVPSTPASGLGRGNIYDQIYSSPAFMKRLRASGGETSSPIIDQLERENDEDLDSEIARKRRRVSYKHVTEWKVARDERQESDEAVGLGLNLEAEVEKEAEEQVTRENLATREVGDPFTESTNEVQQEPPVSSTGLFPASSPSLQSHPLSRPQTQIEEGTAPAQATIGSPGGLTPEHGVVNQVQSEEEALPEAAELPMATPLAASVDFASAMAPPPLPRLEIPQTGSEQQVSDQIGPVTPRLVPVSPGSLPLPSPFPQTPLGTLSPSMIQVPTVEGEDVRSTESVARPEYFDRPPSNNATISTHPEQSQSNRGSLNDSQSSTDEVREVTDLLDEASKPTSVISHERDAASSPSSGSEADVSSEDGDGSDNNATRPQEDTEQAGDSLLTIRADLNKSASLIEVTEEEVLYQEDNSVLAEDQDPDALVHTSDGRESVSLSGGSDDNAEDDLEQDLGQSRMQVLEDVVMLDDAYEDQYGSSSTPASVSPEYHRRDESAGAEEPDSSFYPSFGLDGAFSSKMQDDTHARTEPLTTEGTTLENARRGNIATSQLDDESMRLSQDEDAAWAALDEAITTVKEQERDRKVTETPVGILGEIADDDDDQPDSQNILESQSPKDLPEGVDAIIENEAAVIEDNDRYESKLASQKSSFVKRMEAFRETSQRLRRSPSIEEVDLSQVEPDYMNAYLSQTLSKTLRPATIVDDEESLLHTITRGDGVPAYHESFGTETNQSATDTAEKVLSSREAEIADYLQAQTITSESDLVTEMIKQEPCAQASLEQAEDEAIDDELLLEFVNAEESTPRNRDPALEDANAEAAVDPEDVEKAITPVYGDTARMTPSSNSELVADLEDRNLSKSVDENVEAPAAHDTNINSEVSNVELAANQEEQEEATRFIDGGILEKTPSKIVTEMSTDKAAPSLAFQSRSQAEERMKRFAEDFESVVSDLDQTDEAPPEITSPQTPLSPIREEPTTTTTTTHLTQEQRMQRFAEDFASVASDTRQASEAPSHVALPQTTFLPVHEEPITTNIMTHLTEEQSMRRFVEDFASVASERQQASETPSDAALQQTALLPVPEELIATPVMKHLKDRTRMTPRYSRLSLNTEALSDWFTPPKAVDRRKTTTALPIETYTKPDLPRLPSITSQTRSVSPPPLKRFSQTPGTTTKLSYFTPLTNLETFLNEPLSTVDVLAVVCDKASDPVRAKSGPRDWFTVFSIVDPEILDQTTSDTMTAPWKYHGVT
ncbi:hypothetical protein MBLNU457_g0895t1 [Dothideomycetes sp. NU457]